MQRVGNDVHKKVALDLLKGAGCDVDGFRVKIPSYIVEEAIRKAPSRFTLFKRTGEPAIYAEGKKSYFGSAPTAPYQIDLKTGSRRLTLKKDISESSLIMDALENIDFIMPLGSIQDVADGFSDIYEFAETVFNTNKPIAFIANNKKNFDTIIEMASIIRGGLEHLIDKPFLVAFPQSIAPLVHPKEGIDILLRAAELKIPSAYTTCPTLGLTSPITLASTLVIANMEILTGVVISQIKNPGAPIIIGTCTNGVNMETGNISVGAPELPMGVVAYGQIARFYKIPSWGTAGESDSKIIDEQAGIEGAFSCIFNLLAGLNMIHDLGFLEMALTSSIEMVVMMEEVVGMAKKFQEGISTDPESIAKEIIEKVGPGGSYIGEMHTASKFRDELWFPTLMDRNTHEKWVNKKSLRLSERVKIKSLNILKSHKPIQLNENIKTKIINILDNAVKEKE